ncbi:MAG: hypothetical protein ACXVPN_04070 [Bacteroidia bacterium]
MRNTKEQMNQKANEILSTIKGKKYKDTQKEKTFVVADLVPKTKNEDQPENWNLYVVTEKINEGNDDFENIVFYEINYNYFLINCQLCN